MHRARACRAASWTSSAKRVITTTLESTPRNATHWSTHDYIRHGTTDLFAALDVRAGTVIGEVHRRHRSVDFRHFLATVERCTPPGLELHLVLDNASTHKTPLIQRWLVPHPRVHLHFTPTSSSWINLVECLAFYPHCASVAARQISLDSSP